MPPACSRRSPTPALQAARKRHGRDARGRPHDLVRPQPAAHAVGVARGDARTGSTSSRRRPTGCCPGMEEGRFLTGESTPEGIARFYRERGAKLVVVKLGADGAYYDSDVAGTGHVAGLPGRRKWSTPWAPATASRSAWSARCSKAAACPRRCAAAPGSARAPCRCWATPKACRRAAQLRGGRAVTAQERPGLPRTAGRPARAHQAVHDVTVANPRKDAAESRLRGRAAAGAGPDRLQLRRSRRRCWTRRRGCEVISSDLGRRRQLPAGRAAAGAASCCATRRAC